MISHSRINLKINDRDGRNWSTFTSSTNVMINSYCGTYANLQQRQIQIETTDLNK